MGKEDKKGERRFSQEQYEMLLRCSEKKDMTEWNKWREEQPDEEILLQDAWLEGAHLESAWLVDAHLEHANLRESHLENANLGDAHLEKAVLVDAHLENANLIGAHLENAQLWHAHLERAILVGAHLENADLRGAHQENACLIDAHLENADLSEAHLENASLTGANLEKANLRGAGLQAALLVGADLHDAKLMGASLEGTQLTMGANLQGADFSRAIVDGKTLIDERCEVDPNTKFEAVALGNMRIYPRTRQLLEYNIRRMNWDVWYKEHWLLRWPVRWFWHLSNYGLSTWRVIIWFLVLAFFFAAVYANWAIWWPPGVVNDLSVEAHEPLWHYFGLLVARPVYFAIVTMTTLGFGDMYANKGSIAGHVILALQVILGYVLLGALVTRFAVLFTAGGPAGKFSKRE